MRRADRDLLAGEGDRAGIRSLDPGQDLDQGRLAGAVLTDEGMDLALPEGEVHALEGLNPREALVDALHGQERVRVCHDLPADWSA